MTKKKSGFWTFIFSLMPGAAEMYMGFMKMGVSLMGLFCGVAFLAGFFGTGIIALIDVIIWFYGFFHAHNLRAMDDEDFYALEDDYLIPMEGFAKDFWTKAVVSRYRKIVAAVLILFGVSILWDNFVDIMGMILPPGVFEYIASLSYRLPQIVLGVGIIAVGLMLIRGKKQELLENDTEEAEKNGGETSDQNP